MIKVRYTPNHKGRGTFNGVAPGEVTEVSEETYALLRDVYTPVDEPDAPEPQTAPDEPAAARVVDLLPLIAASDDLDWLRVQSKDDRKTVRDRALARMRMIESGSPDSQ